MDGELNAERRRILAISSGGGHWVQLLRLRPAWAAMDTTYASVYPESQADLDGERFFSFCDASRSNPLGFFRLFWQLCRILFVVRPHVIVTTGSAPALVAILLGRLTGARTLWIDSIANSEKLSTSGEIAVRIAHECFTQWRALERPGGPRYMGQVL